MKNTETTNTTNFQVQQMREIVSTVDSGVVAPGQIVKEFEKFANYFLFMPFVEKLKWFVRAKYGVRGPTLRLHPIEPPTFERFEKVIGNLVDAIENISICEDDQFDKGNDAGGGIDPNTVG